MSSDLVIQSKQSRLEKLHLTRHLAAIMCSAACYNNLITWAFKNPLIQVQRQHVPMCLWNHETKVVLHQWLWMQNDKI